MKRMTCVGAIVLGLAVATGPVAAGDDERSVTAAGKGLFGAGAVLGAVTLQSLEVGAGVLIEADGSASGTFHAVLQGRLLGLLRRNITVEGKASEGSIGAVGRASFSGTASLDLGDGSLPLLNVPFSVTAGPDGLALAIESVTLPVAVLTAGAVRVE